MKKIRKISEKLPSLSKKKQVAAYARVSIDSEELAHSFAAQIDYYTKLIDSNPEWDNVGIYADYGISGTGTSKREQFNQMIEDAYNGKIDLIITKSIQRFARNTVDLLNVVRDLKEKGIEVYFERENIYSLSGDGELMLTLIASFAQEESRSISENIKWGIRKRFEQGIPNSKNRIYGYNWKDGVPVIVPEEAKIVRMIFQEYLSGKSKPEIAKELNEKEIRALKGGKWKGGSIRNILTNLIYKGDLLLQKTFVKDHLTHKRIKNNGELPMYLVSNNHEGIVSRELFDSVQRQIKKNGVYSYCFSRNPQAFTAKIVCGKCGCNFIFSSRHSAWYCNSRKVLKKYCQTIRIPDQIVKSLAEEALKSNGFRPNQFEEIKQIYVYEDYRVNIILRTGIIYSCKWERPKRKWSDDDIAHRLKSLYQYRRTGKGRYSEFTSRIINPDNGKSFYRHTCNTKTMGIRNFWRIDGIGIEETKLKETIQNMMGWDEYMPQNVIDSIDEIFVSDKDIKLKLLNGEIICQER